MPLKSSAQKVQDALIAGGFDNHVIELEISARTSQEAADAVGCNVAQIAKSLIFATEQTGRGVLVITSGANRVDTSAVATAVRVLPSPTTSPSIVPPRVTMRRARVCTALIWYSSNFSRISNPATSSLTAATRCSRTRIAARNIARARGCFSSAPASVVARKALAADRASCPAVRPKPGRT